MPVLSSTVRAVLVGVVACALAAVFVGLARRLAVRFGISTVPSAARWNPLPTPYLGGAGIALAVVLSCITIVEGPRGDIGILLGTALVVGLVGLLDDLRELSPLVRVAAEAAGAGVVCAAGTRVSPGPLAVEVVLTIAWFVLVVNACNLLDNVDGALASTAMVMGIATGVAAVLAGQPQVAGICFALAGASLGFLVHNWHPATIFMGDAGSLFLGFLLAALTIELRTTVGTTTGSVAAVLLVGPALVDTALVVISRVRSGRPVLVGGTDHTSHRLLQRGLVPGRVVAVLAASTAVSSSLGVAVARSWVHPLVALGGALLLAAASVAWLLRQPGYEQPPRSPA